MHAPATEGTVPGPWTQCKVCFEYFRPNSTDICSCMRKNLRNKNGNDSSSLTDDTLQDTSQLWPNELKNNSQISSPNNDNNRHSNDPWKSAMCGSGSNSGNASKYNNDPWRAACGSSSCSSNSSKKNSEDAWNRNQAGKTSPLFKNQWDFYKDKQLKDMESSSLLPSSSSCVPPRFILVVLLLLGIAACVGDIFGICMLVEYLSERQRCFDSFGRVLQPCFDVSCQKINVWVTEGVCSLLLPLLIISGCGFALVVIVNLIVWQYVFDKTRLFIVETTILIVCATAACCAFGPAILVAQNEVQSSCGSNITCASSNCSMVFLEDWACKDSSVGIVLTAVGYSSLALLLYACIFCIRRKVEN